MSKQPVPKGHSGNSDIQQFIQRSNTLPQRQRSDKQHSGRLIFALDATASRQPSWDHACQLQSEMFLATQALGGLAVQLCYYRGFNEFHHSRWLTDSTVLLDVMNQVRCLGGHTQLSRTLDHCLLQTHQQKVQAVVIIGDAIEENPDTLCDKAGQLGLLGTPLFMFQEGSDIHVRRSFQQMATLSRGAYAHFNQRSAAELAALLNAVATYAGGGYQALKALPSNAAKQLIKQISS